MPSLQEHQTKVRDATDTYVMTVANAWETYQQELARIFEVFHYGEPEPEAPMKTVRTVDYTER